jgi:hypothetical protein
MRHTPLLCCLLAALGCALLAGCAAEPRREARPAATARAPVAGPSFVRAQRAGAPSVAIAVLAEMLEQRGFTITRLDPEGGILIARRAAAPLDYVDCRPLATGSQSGNVRPAAAAVENGAGGRLELETRLVVTAAERGANQIELASSGDFVVIETLPGAGGRSQVDYIFFKTGEQAQLASGTRCRSSQRLEREALG